MRWDSFTDRGFEELVARLFTKMGYTSVELTPATADKGIDVIASRKDELGHMLKYAAQCKRYINTKVGSDTVRDFGSALQLVRADFGVIVTSSGFTKDALETARTLGKIMLWDGSMLEQKLSAHGMLPNPGRTSEDLPADEAQRKAISVIERHFPNVKQSKVLEARRKHDGWAFRISGVSKMGIVSHHWQVNVEIDHGGGLTNWEVLSQSEKSGCFIATAAFGSHLAPELDHFRTFRDKVLMKFGVGRALVDVYYRASPPIADLISNSPRLRKACRVFLLAPAMKIIKDQERRDV